MKLSPSLLCLSFLSLGGLLLTANAEVDTDAITEYLEGILEESGAPSISVAVGLNGKIAHQNAVGLAAMEPAIPAAPETVYRTGSIAKVITTVAAMQLIEQGKLSLETDVREFVPEYPAKVWTVTVENLLTHTSGIRHYARPDWIDGGAHSINYPSTLSALSIFKDDPLLFEPGTDYLYSTYAFTLLQAVIEAATGQDFEIYLKDNIWMPAGMAQTELERVSHPVPEFATGYIQIDAEGNIGPVEPHNVTYKYAGGGMLSTPTDLVKFVQALQNQKLLTTDSLNRMWQTPYADLQANQAYGWRTEENNGRQIIHMGGSISGFKSFLVFWPDSGLSIAVMSNRDNFDYRSKIAFHLGELYFEAL